MIKKRILPVVMILAAFLLQTTVFQSIKLAGAVPNLLLVLTITYGYLRGRTSGLVIGFFSGLLLDCLYGSVIGLYAFIFMTIGFVVGFCKKIYFTDSLIPSGCFNCLQRFCVLLLLLCHRIFNAWQTALGLLFYS